jgi:acyl carrier protein
MINTEQRVRKLVAEQLLICESRVIPEATFVEDLGADSLDRVEMVMNVETAFGIEITEKESEAITTVQDVLNLIQARAKLAA